MIQFNQVCKTFDTTRLFENINLFLPKASYTFIGGSAGCGKTTLFKLMMASEKPDSGTVRIDDLEINSLPQERIPFLRRQIGLVETVPLLLENRTVAENIAVPLQIAEFDSKAQKYRVTESLEDSGLAILTNVPVQRLDADQRRLVALVRATIHRPGILLVDTAAEQLRESSAASQMEIVQKTHNNGTTVVIAGNKSELAEATKQLPAGGSALVFNNGKLYPHERDKHPTES